MVTAPEKSPYKGFLIFLIIMALPPVVLTGMFFVAINFYQPKYGFELNFATAKILGCGMGAMFHFCCWIFGAFKDDFKAVKTRWKEFFFNLSISAKLAFKCYFEDLKTLGVAFWLDMAIVGINLYIFIDAVFDYIAIRH